jgi:hypothetical protein
MLDNVPPSAHGDNLELPFTDKEIEKMALTEGGNGEQTLPS